MRRAQLVQAAPSSGADAADRHPLALGDLRIGDRPVGHHQAQQLATPLGEARERLPQGGASFGGDERLLRSRVQAFNRLFEKLLDTISETEGAEQVMEQVLASEQGRIYVMLAEVAGRLPSQS